MAINSVTNWQNFKCYINDTGSAGTPTAATASDDQVKGLLTVGGSPGVTASLATAAPIDQALVLKAKGSQDPGQITMSFVRDDDDAGQIDILAAAKDQLKYAFFLTKGTGLTMNFEGLVTAAVNPGGSGTDFAMLNVTVDLTAFPT